MLNDLRGLPPAAGLRAHVELARISGYIVCNTYRVAPWEHQMTTTSARIDTALSWLSSWLLKLPLELRMRDDQLNNDRASLELHMLYNQVQTAPFSPSNSIRSPLTLWPVVNHPDGPTDFLRRCQESCCGAFHKPELESGEPSSDCAHQTVQRSSEGEPQTWKIHPGSHPVPEAPFQSAAQHLQRGGHPDSLPAAGRHAR